MIKEMASLYRTSDIDYCHYSVQKKKSSKISGFNKKEIDLFLCYNFPSKLFLKFAKGFEQFRVYKFK